MSDNLEIEGSTEEESTSPADVFYSDDSEPDEPTELAEEGDAEEDLEEEESEADEGESLEDSEEEEEAEVIDKPNDFVKYDFDEDSGLYEFKSMGKKVKVNTDELINNYQAGLKLNVELEKLAKNKKGEFDGAKAEELKTLQSEAQRVQGMAAQLESLIKETDEQIDWEELRDTDPSEYLKQKELKKSREDALKQASSDRDADLQARRAKARESEAAKLTESIPEWADEKLMMEEAKGMHEHALAKGFSQEEMNLISDHRFWLMIKDSYELDKINTKEVKEVRKLPKSVKTKRAASTKRKEEPKSDADIFYS
jgi:hypothetical protein